MQYTGQYYIHLLHMYQKHTLESRIIGGVGIIERGDGVDIVIFINNRGCWTWLKKQCRRFLSTYAFCLCFVLFMFYFHSYNFIKTAKKNLIT